MGRLIDDKTVAKMGHPVVVVRLDVGHPPPVDQHMMERSAEIAMAQSAAPPSISKDAEVMVMGRHGYEVAVKGKNGFVCMVERGWTAGVDDPVFWNPKIRGPICINPQAARFNVPITMKKTELVLGGDSKEQMAAGIEAGSPRRVSGAGVGAMCYMLSKQGHLNDEGGAWHPHLMFSFRARSLGRGVGGVSNYCRSQGPSRWVHAVYDSGWEVVG